MITCPFCNETDFDELGLEIHLACYCMGDQSPKINSLAYRQEQEESRNIELVQVTHDMAVDAGDRSLEGQYIEW
jgi:hypothetical protein